MRWFEHPPVLNYIIDSYAGVEKQKRQFIWEDESGNIVIGNTRAFTDHLAAKFNLKRTETSWAEVHHAMWMLGEVAKGYTPRVNKRGGKFINQLPEVRVIRRKALR